MDVAQMTELDLRKNWLINSIKSSVERVKKSDSVSRDRLGKISDPDFINRVEKILCEDKDLRAA
jgi:hypothetical protein